MHKACIYIEGLEKEVKNENSSHFHRLMHGYINIHIFFSITVSKVPIYFMLLHLGNMLSKEPVTKDHMV